MQFFYSIRVTNNGPTTATSIKVVDTLPEGADFDNAGGRDWECEEPVGRLLTCWLPSLAAGASNSALIIAVSPAPQGGTLVNAVTLSAAEADPMPGNNTATDSALVNPAPATSFYTVVPCRMLDTRDPIGPGGGPVLAANQTRQVIVRDCGLPFSRALAVNVTVVGATDAGDLRIHAWGTKPPTSSTINFRPGDVRANSAVISLVWGAIAVECDMAPGSTGTVHLIIDVFGYFN